MCTHGLVSSQSSWAWVYTMNVWSLFLHFFYKEKKFHHQPAKSDYIHFFPESSSCFFPNVNFSDVKFIHFYGKYLTFEPVDGFSKFKCLNALKFCQDSKYCGQPSNNNYLTAVQPSNNNYSTAELHSHLYVYFYSLLGKINNM